MSFFSTGQVASGVRTRWPGWSPSLALVALLSAPAVLAGRLAFDAPVDETLKEVVASLDASSVARVPLERYALAGLEALGRFDRCLSRSVEGAALSLSCNDRSLTAPWPPSRAADVASLLSNAVRLVDPTRELRPERVERVCRALAIAVDDPFTAYLPPAMMATAATMKNGMSAALPGIELWPREPSKVRDVRLGSDAAQKGISPGDRLLTVDGVDVGALTYFELLQRLSGLNGTDIRLRVEPVRGGPAREVAVTRLLVPEDDLRRGMVGSVLYVGVPAFKSGAASSVRHAIGAGVFSGVILDLRHNNGGLLSEGIALVDLFLRDGAIGGVRSGPGRPTDDFVAHRDDFDSSLPLVVLIDGQSASASEFTAMVLKERGRALVLGAPTAGKGSVQRQIPLPDGGLLKVTAGFYVGPTGRRLDEGGVRPHRFLAPSPRRTALEGGVIGDDAWVLAALDSLQQVERSAVLRPAVGPTP
jgi:C-terminal peptidase prc